MEDALAHEIEKGAAASGEEADPLAILDDDDENDESYRADEDEERDVGRMKVESRVP